MKGNAIEVLESALRAVLGEKFDTEIRAVVEEQAWYRPDLPIEEVFRLWVSNNISKGESASWVFQPLRAGERKYLSDRLGIERPSIVGKSPLELAEAVLESSGLPVFHMTSIKDNTDTWIELVNLVSNGEDERAAVISRQRAERLLRKIIHFYSSLSYSAHLLQMLENPGSLNVPNKITSILSISDEQSRRSKLTDLFLVDGWADLGFLSLALRKFSSRLEQTDVRHLSGAALVLFTVQEHDGFTKLGTALQSYTHDKPSKMSSRKAEFRDALLEVQSSIAKMINRNVIPDEIVVLEKGLGFAGTTFRASSRPQITKCYRTTVPPEPGMRVLVVASADCDYAQCQWIESPWPIE